MAARGSPAWYRRNDVRPFDPQAELDRRRNTARAHGMFDEHSERQAFEEYFASSRRSRGATFLAECFNRAADGSYASEPTQRHWFTWQMSVGAGRIPPKFDPIKIAADRLRAEAAGATK